MNPSPPRLFGTDGIRGAAGKPPLDRVGVTRLGRELGHAMLDAGEAPHAVLGGDTRDSTPDLARWIAAGLRAEGVSCQWAGVVPTPAVAYLARSLGSGVGVVISASHNPHPDNGIKLIDPQGFKWSRLREIALEQRLAQASSDALPEAPELTVEPSLAESYLASVSAAGASLDGLSMAVDAGNGAASAFAGRLFADLGAQVTLLHTSPDGTNINRECGSTRPEIVADEVVRGGHALGIAFDGDADRAIVVDENGEIRDGDAVLFLWALELAERGELQPARIVATSMSNIGLERALAPYGIGVERCDVGDRTVVETLRNQGLKLGGEQSGHIVNLDRSTTGDGLLTALAVASRVAVQRRRLSVLLDGFERFPQILLGVKVSSKPPLEEIHRIAEASREIEAALGSDGRLVLRYSGTEPLARVMIEGVDRERIETMAQRLAGVIEEEIG